MRYKFKGGADFSIVLFNLALAETPDDEAIERLVHETVEFLAKRATKRGMMAADLLCVVQEVCARVHMSCIAPGSTQAETEKLAADMSAIIARRMITFSEGVAPGDKAWKPDAQ